MYKVLAKILANRLSKVVHRVIENTHFAFIQKRKILDRVLIANELVKKPRKSDKKMIMFKVDFEKAYDLADLEFLLMVMEEMDFQKKRRRDWIQECLSTTTILVLVNGNPTPYKGIGLWLWS